MQSLRQGLIQLRRRQSGIIYILPFLCLFLLVPGKGIAHLQSFAPFSEGAGFIPHTEATGPFMYNPCAQGYWEAAKITMQTFSAPLPLIYTDEYFDYLIYQGYLAAEGGAIAAGSLSGAIGVINAAGGVLGSVIALPKSCFAFPP